jgi:dihydrofolate reductase
MNIIVATCKKNGIGFMGKLPWHIPMEMNYFKHITKLRDNNAIILGHNTWKKDFFHSPLPERHNIILSRNFEKDNTGREKEFKFLKSKENVYDYVKTNNYDDLWVVGGNHVYKDYLSDNNVKYVFKTQIYQLYNCDTYFPWLPKHYNNVYISTLFNAQGIRYTINIYENKNYDTDIDTSNKPSLNEYILLIENEWVKTMIQVNKL